MKVKVLLLSILAVLIVLSIILFLFYYPYYNKPKESDNMTGSLGTGGVFSTDNENLTGELGSLNPIASSNLGISDMFADAKNMHWPHMPVTYNVSNCSETRLERIFQATDYIEEATEVISFEISGDNPDISIICTNNQKDRGYVAGEAELNYYIGTNIYAPSIVYIYYSNHCIGRRPTIEIHELLHVFGLGHSQANEWDNIMNPYTTQCEVDISQEDIAYLKETYYTSPGGLTGGVISDIGEIDIRGIIKKIFGFFNLFD